MTAPPTPSPITPIESRGYARPDVLVSTDWVARHLDDPLVRLVESDEDLLLYETGHIPGAVKIDWVNDLNDPVVRDYLDRTRFERLHARCLEMRGIAAGVRGAAGDQPGTAEDIRTPGLDRLLWLFLRLLLSKTALDRFLRTMNESELSAKLAELRTNIAAAQAAGDDRIVRSLQDSIAMAELRLDNSGRAKKNADFVSVELDRIEGKIQALAETAVNRQDPDFLSSQVDSAAESMRQTEKAVSELQHLTGLADQLEEPPAILEADLREVLRHDA